MPRSTTLRWTLLGIAVFLLILVPFLLFESSMNAFVAQAMETLKARPIATAVFIAVLLMLDIFLPIPSSVVSTMAGGLLGFIPSTIAIWSGMTACCVLGYWMARLFARQFERFLGAKEKARLEHVFARHGLWAIALCRPVPILAEASVIFAGLAGMDFMRFLLLSTLANAGVALVYAAVGALAAGANAFLLAFFASILLPWLAMTLTRYKPAANQPT
ncbi:MAG: VTT domain-containing protein [Verrucomicrobiota bacterium]|nr:VTT domain-containing protein [Verrucomicrobiota bacterium]